MIKHRPAHTIEDIRRDWNAPHIVNATQAGGPFWVAVGGVTLTVAANAPSSPEVGDLWVDTTP